MSKKKAKLADPAPPVPRVPHPAAAFLARWANLVACLKILDNEAWKVWKLAQNAEECGREPFLAIDVEKLHALASDIHAIAGGANFPHFKGSLDFIPHADRTLPTAVLFSAEEIDQLSAE